MTSTNLSLGLNFKIEIIFFTISIDIALKITNRKGGSRVNFHENSCL